MKSLKSQSNRIWRNRMEKILGLDLGSRTCGIAMSDALGMLAHGLETYRFNDGNYKQAANN